MTLSSGTTTTNVPADSLVARTDKLTATYTPDSASSSIYSGVSSTISETVTTLIPTLTVTPSSSSVTTEQALSIAVAVNGGIGNPTPTGSVTLVGGGYTSAAMPLSSGSAIIDISAEKLVAGSDTLTVTYTPDALSSPIYGAGSATTSVTVTTPIPPRFTVTGTAVTVAPGATTGNNSTITVTPAGGLTGSVALTAVITSGPVGALDPPTFSFGSTSPVSITGTAAETATLTISTTASTSASLYNRKGKAFLGTRLGERRWSAPCSSACQVVDGTGEPS